MTYYPTRGFTLIETMVAISVLAVALVGPFIAVRNALQASYVARDQLVAATLAEEGMEYLRSIRDNNYLAERSWLDGFSSAVRDGCYGSSPSGVCTVDPTRGDFHADSSGMLEHSSVATAPLLYLSSAGLYNQQSSGTATRFKRTVQIFTLTATEIRIVVTVTWTTSGQAYTVIVTDNLHNWL